MAGNPPQVRNKALEPGDTLLFGIIQTADGQTKLSYASGMSAAEVLRTLLLTMEDVRMQMMREQLAGGGNLVVPARIGGG